MPLITAREENRVTSVTEYYRWVLGMRSVRVLARSSGIKLRAEAVEVDETLPPVVAYVSHGRWVADCPTPGCSGAMLLFFGAGFFCGNCLNVQTGLKAREVIWPEHREEIERLLLLRPVPQTRSWFPTEPVNNLVAENLEHGIGG